MAKIEHSKPIDKINICSVAFSSELDTDILELENQPMPVTTNGGTLHYNILSDISTHRTIPVEDIKNYDQINSTINFIGIDQTITQDSNEFLIPVDLSSYDGSLYATMSNEESLLSTGVIIDQNNTEIWSATYFDGDDEILNQNQTYNFFEEGDIFDTPLNPDLLLQDHTSLSPLEIDNNTSDAFSNYNITDHSEQSNRVYSTGTYNIPSNKNDIENSRCNNSTDLPIPFSLIETSTTQKSGLIESNIKENEPSRNIRKHGSSRSRKKRCRIVTDINRDAKRRKIKSNKNCTDLFKDAYGSSQTIFQNQCKVKLRSTREGLLYDFLKPTESKKESVREYGISLTQIRVFLSIIIYYNEKYVEKKTGVCFKYIGRKVCLSQDIKISNKFVEVIANRLKNEVNTFSKTADYIKWRSLEIVDYHFKTYTPSSAEYETLKNDICNRIDNYTYISNNESSVSQIKKLILLCIRPETECDDNKELVIVKRLFLSLFKTEEGDLLTYGIVRPGKKFFSVITKYISAFYFKDNKKIIKSRFKEAFKDILKLQEYKNLKL
ncbi:MAG: hypothetical protein ACRDDF_00745 [Aeromonas sp.]